MACDNRTSKPTPTPEPLFLNPRSSPSSLTQASSSISRTMPTRNYRTQGGGSHTPSPPTCRWYHCLQMLHTTVRYTLKRLSQRRERQKTRRLSCCPPFFFHGDLERPTPPLSPQKSWGRITLAINTTTSTLYRVLLIEPLHAMPCQPSPVDNLRGNGEARGARRPDPRLQGLHAQVTLKISIYPSFINLYPSFSLRTRDMPCQQRRKMCKKNISSQRRRKKHDLPQSPLLNPLPA